MKHVVRLLPALLPLLVVAVARPAGAQPPPPPPSSLWIASGGAVGETAIVAFASHYAGNDDFALAWSPAIHPEPRFPQLAPPIFLLRAGTLTTTRTVVHPIPLPAGPNLAGVPVFLQAAFGPGLGQASAVLTWVVAPAGGRRFALANASPSHGVGPDDGHARATLADGTVLLTGGRDLSLPGPRFRNAATIYDPKRAVARAAGYMHAARGGHVMRRLADGRILIVGGDQDDRQPIAELYHPASGTFTTLAVPGFLQDPAATVIREPGTGREFVLVAGGRASRDGSPASTAFLFDAAAGRFLALPGLASARVHAATAALAGGTVLVTGGRGAGATVHDDAELFVLAARRFYPWGRMTRARYGHAAVALDPYRALVISGGDSSGALADLEVFDGITRQSRRLPHRLCFGRIRFTPAVLADGAILVAGGAEDRRAYPGRTPEVIGATGVSVLRPIGAPQPDIALQPLPGGGAVAFGLTSVHHLP